MRVVVRAFNADGYHRDILIMSEKQVHRQDVRTGDVSASCMSGLIGWGGSIDPKAFPEMVRFEVVVEHKSV